MKFKEILARITGISCPVFGVSWNPPEADVTLAKHLITFLEDRRTLFNPMCTEVPEQCVQSILGIREYLNRLLITHLVEKDLSDSIRAMRAACRKFLDVIPQAEKDKHYFLHGPHFRLALGELRGVFGIHVAKIAVQYGIDLEENEDGYSLSSILPEKVLDDDT